MIYPDDPSSLRKILANPAINRCAFLAANICFDSDPPAPSTGESTASIMQSLTQYLPGYMRVVNEQVLPQARTELKAAQEISPAYTQLLSEIYRQYAPELAKTGTEVERINRLGAADTDLAILQGKGGELARESQKVDRELNPEFYATREKAAGSLSDLLGSINMGDANPEAERLVNQENIRSGNLGNTNATNTVSNALSFGREADNRRNQLGQAIGLATNFMQPSQGQFNPVVTALNRPSTNTGETRFEGINKPSDQAYQAGQGMFSGITSLRQQENDINANRRDTLDRLNETTSALGGVSV